uniref:Uncharacterized protein n=1 Tax=Candidatus Kentrum sp. MB TaxID=2138164 RepID=A0A450XYJ2_9GAMM|nr:MAG: hypothetical protein BECKMB1821I_GA0114274_10699 [Candidatus Kentron sp. MB]VFK76678.1 MAG: hypothetical protein BECKMB1821H_GA0114242_10688 [Candidatus Kentron sp. MB]
MFGDFLASLNPLWVSAIAATVIALVAISPLIPKFRNACAQRFRRVFSVSLNPHWVTAVAATLAAIATLAIAITVVFPQSTPAEGQSISDAISEKKKIRCREGMVQIPAAHYSLTDFPFDDSYLESLYIAQLISLFSARLYK